MAPLPLGASRSLLMRVAGEMVFPWMFEDFKELAKLREAAELLAADAGALQRIKAGCRCKPQPGVHTSWHALHLLARHLGRGRLAATVCRQQAAA